MFDTLAISDHHVFGAAAADCWYFRLSNLNYLFLFIFYFSVIYFSVFKNTKKSKILKYQKYLVVVESFFLESSLFIMVITNIVYFFSFCI